MSNGNQYCTFFLEDLFFGVDVTSVQEVIRYQEMTPVPLAPNVIEGFINLRGQIVTAVDLRKRLEMAARDEGNHPMNVVVNRSSEAISLLVDKIGDVIEIDEASFEPPPDTLTGVTREVLHGVYKLEGRLLLVLNIDKILDFH